MRAVRVLGACLSGARAELVTVEARFTPAERDRCEVLLTGLPDPVLRESRARVQCALEESGLAVPGGRLHLNLVPAARRKSGEILDLPLALGAAAAVGHLRPRRLEGTLFLGELGIDGALHAVPGGLAAAVSARAAGVANIVAPSRTAEEAACLGGAKVFAARHLAQVVAHVVREEGLLEPVLGEAPAARPPDPGGGLDEVRGQELGKRVLAVAAAGGHAALLVGPPGTGKSMLARRLSRLLPPPTLEERIEITQVLSAAGRWPGGLVTERPFRAPHHTASYAGLVGGGHPLTPGEITLSHRGVLFLDELPEFRREALEALREPLETGSVTVSRASDKLELPARFQLVSAMNPCPCGYLGHPRVPCSCSPYLVARYRRRLSGPLLDRVELRVDLPAPTLELLAPSSPESPPPGTREVELRARVTAARALAAGRQGALPNAELGAADLDRFVPLERDARELCERAAHDLGLSARAVQALRRVARTLADLDGEERVAARHLAEALSLRRALP